jgi:hypothetical protein
MALEEAMRLGACSRPMTETSSGLPSRNHEAMRVNMTVKMSGPMSGPAKALVTERLSLRWSFSSLRKTMPMSLLIA